MFYKRTLCLLLAVALSPIPAVLAQATAAVTTPLDAVPPNIRASAARPMIMLNMSRDHQLFYRAYNEFSDLDPEANDGPETSYKHSFNYYGYFDPQKCYTYNNTDGRFEPSAMADSSKYCSSAWSGNFLNWATMTRMDVVRKVLYGGYRSTDSTTQTVLERVHLPTDAHSFAKYYNGTDISSLTPFNVTELTMCNTTLGSSTSTNVNYWSHTNTNPPLMRVAQGNYALWNANERWQCYWNEEKGASNGNSQAVTGLASASSNPVRGTVGLNHGGGSPDYRVRVEVCKASLIGSERCKTYTSGGVTTRKPIGLLHEYGETDLAEFGLITGSFNKNISGGVLRRNVTSFSSEVNANGTFKTSGGSYNEGIVYTLNKMRVYGYRYEDGTYRNNNGASFCDFQTIGLNNGECESWGNPIGEMFLEALRYFSGQTTPSSTFDYTTGARDAAMGLPKETWVDPFTRGATIDDKFGKPVCRPVNVLNFNASVTSYDRDNLDTFSDLNSGTTVATLTDRIGQVEGIHGKNWFVGSNGTTSDNMCTAKGVTALSTVEGLCPDAPAYKGSFSLPALAYWAHTNPVRTAASVGLPGTTELSDTAFRVNTFGVALTPGKPRIEVAVPGETGKKVIIQPAYVLRHPTRGTGSGTLVDFRVVSQTPTYGKYVVIWEDSEQGGDYDQDASGILEYQVSGNTLYVTTSTFADATANPQGFGYTISGTNKDGVHFHSGILGFSYTDPTNLTVTRADGTAHPNVNASGGCNNCNKNQAASRAQYTMTGTAGSSLEDPLWYASKWGGFKVTSGSTNDVPDTTAKWDSRSANGLAGSDGVPDNYFLVFNPDRLESALRSAFDVILAASNAAPAVSSSQLIAGSYKYIAKFDPDRRSGSIEAYRVLSSGAFDETLSWEGGANLLQATNAGTRKVITNDAGTGEAFVWSELSADYRTALQTGLPGSMTTAQKEAWAQQLISYVRGSNTNEGFADGQFRPRNGNILGPIINATPWIQGRPTARYIDALFPGYSTFAQTHRERAQLLWVAANDGMLHAFNASTGAPIISYVPGTLASRLRELTLRDTSITALVDGSPFSADVRVGSGDDAAWRTYTFGSLGRGGRGIFALDTTSVSSLTEAAAGSVFKWQFGADVDSDFGYILGDPGFSPISGQASPVVKLNNGKFALALGNGYGSTDGKAALFLIEVDGPDGASWTGRYKKIVADTSGGNGLSAATWIDADNNGTADYIYAGDLKGNLWKFNVSSASADDWGLAYGVPVFTARDSETNALPITSAPQFLFHPNGGVLLNIATGRSIVDGDFPNTSVTQRVFGVWERPNSTVAALPAQADLVARVLERLPTGEVVVTSGQTINWTDKDGWYFDLPTSSEMVISNPEFRQQTLVFTSIMPSEDDALNCYGTPNATLYTVNALNGTPPVGVQGTVTDSGGVVRVVMGSAILDQRVRTVTDRTGLPFKPGGIDGRGVDRWADGEICEEGSPNCKCKVIEGTKQCRLEDPPDCPPGFAVRAIGKSTDEALCFSPNNSRIQWREIPGLNTLN